MADVPKTLSEIIGLTEASMINMPQGRLIALRKEAAKLQAHFRSHMHQADATVDRISKHLDRRAVREVEVSDHALLRYMERVLGVDTQAIRDSIAVQVTARQPMPLGEREIDCGSYIIGVADGYRVTTVLLPDMATKPKEQS